MENIADKTRHDTHHFKRGERHPFAIVREEQAKRMIAMFKAGTPTRAIAAQFNLKLYTVEGLVRGRSWKHLHNPEVSGS